jgi:short subunit dehydrogenase-like uncharacterized protein
MKRVIVLGGSGFFGHLIVERLAAAGLQPTAASRSSGDLRIDANDATSIRANLKQRDLVVDAAGPFHERTSALIDAARSIGFDVVDLSDSADYTAMVYRNAAPISAAGIRVLTACSSLSTVTALTLSSCNIENPRRVTAYLQAASRYTANPGATRSFLANVEERGRTIRFPKIGARGGMRVRTVDSITLPPIFPTLQTIELVVDTGNFAGNLAMQSATLRKFLDRHLDQALKITRKVGNKEGILGYEFAATSKRQHILFTGANTHMVAVIPAIEAARAIAEGRFAERGVIAPTNHISADVFWNAVRQEGINVVR